MKKKQETQVQFLKEVQEKKNYIPPTLEVTMVEMEQGIASGSSSVSPAVSGGVVNSVGTTWDGDDSQVISSDAFD